MNFFCKKFLNFLKLYILIQAVLNLPSARADLNKDRIFINIANPIPCIRRFNATHQIGCAKGDLKNQDGVVYAVRNSIEFNRLEKLKDVNKRDLIVITSPRFFLDVMDFYLKYRVSSKINGIVLNIGNNSETGEYSDDSKSPNNKFGIYSNAPEWNSFGKNYNFEKYDIPIYVITNQNDANVVFYDCYEKFNKKIFQTVDTAFNIASSDLLCGMQLGLLMSGAVSSSVCVRRSSIQHTLESDYFCDPLGGSNYLTFLSQKPSNSLPITLITSRIDTFTMYEYFTPGANEPISSIIGLMSLAQLLAKYRNNFVKNNLLFVLFDNEAFEYGGSSRFVNDLNLDKFPELKINNSNNSDGADSFILSKLYDLRIIL